MTMKDELFSRLDRTSSIEIRFRANRRKYKQHIFFEGKTDKLFYLEMMAKCDAAPKDFALYECGNRANVIKACDAIPRRSGERCAFFVDHDETAPTVNSDDVYVTAGYSFENFLVKEETFLALVKRNCGFTATEDLAKVTNMFSNFLRSATRFLMRASRLKRHLAASGEPVKWKKIDLVHFSSFLRSGHLVAEQERCKASFFKRGLDLNSYRSSCQGATFRTDASIVYGKGLLRLFTAFFEYLCDLAIAEGRDAIKIKDKSADNMTMILAPLCPLPNDLRTFLTNKFR